MRAGIRLLMENARARSEGRPVPHPEMLSYRPDVTEIAGRDRIYPWEVAQRRQVDHSREDNRKRREAVGALLRTTTLSCTEIGLRVGMTPTGVWRMQRKYFPEFPRAWK